MKTENTPLPRIEFSPYFEGGTRYIAVLMIYPGVSWEAWSIKPPTDELPDGNPVSPKAVAAAMMYAFDFGKPFAEEDITEVFPEIREPYLVKGIYA